MSWIGKPGQAFARTKTRVRVMAFLAGLALAAPFASARAQVMEIDDGGKVTTYDRPAVFDDRGATPIQTPHAERRHVEAFATPVDLSGAAIRAGLSPELIEAVAWRESHMRPSALSPAGAIGEMQLMPATARALGVDPYDSRQNLVGGAAYLSALMRRYDGDLIRALAAYNAGPGAVDRYGGMPPYRETRDYVAAIMDRLSLRLARSEATGEK